LRVLLRRYSENWSADFNQIESRIRSALGTRTKRIDHIGSTAVPHLDAKPVIDILLEVDHVADEHVQTSLETIGYSLIVDEPGHRMFSSTLHDVHIHVWQSGNPEIERHLLFRNWLRKNDEDRRLYEREKHRLAALEWPSQNDYAEAKTSVIGEILARARESGRP
jgi:GrpB-like predicted nucleotidyltransferase (UPF0157 family)